MATIYQDFSKLRSFLPTLRVEELKGIIRTINSYFHVAARLTGKKDELILRIESYLQEAINQAKYDNYDHVRAAIYRYCREPYIPTYHRTSVSGSTPNYNPASQSTSSAGLRANAPVIDLGPVQSAQHIHHQHQQQQPGKADPVFGSTSTPSMMRGYPIKTPSNGSNQIYNSATGQPFPAKPQPYSNNSTIFNSRNLPICFERSPFYRVDSAASSLAICHRAAQNDRKSVPLSLILSPEQRAKLTQTTANPTGSQYQLRMFSTSEAYYQHPGYPSTSATNTSSNNSTPALIEFPTTIEIKLNTCSITSNLKGIKKQPGTAPPPNLASVPGRNGAGLALDLKDGRPNQIEIAYSNSDKRFFFVIYLVEYYGVYGLMKNLKANRKRGLNQVLQEIIASSSDDDVITSASEITLKDPVVFTRIKTPIRSTRCKHLQCFDAEFFYTMMEQTPTWLCPVCNSKLKNEEISVDEYFESILKATPSSIDTVIIEADGKWHDERYDYGTSTKKRSPQSVMSIESGGSRPSASTSSGAGHHHHHQHGDDNSKKRKAPVLELVESDNDQQAEDDDDEDDEDDEDEGSTQDEVQHPKRSRNFKRHKAFGHSADCVIDLTLDDD
ncbi:hypothetical protein MJO28_015931 [Puccinia striiformis f. sp. tritici]|uniref:Uncharacterized protein n=2 Tax=Puccinia striiformis f. sp. tritici TaxID=168172 RepID=A0ACC0DR65_9BASI|nr:hypothetical protein Pst134EA_029034 [Puccinia striiformis f. sp. tritici]KAH9447048.1 hypothetical protein Pst134EA_029034 [Puccinia striiformis f. sp. tritici]KAI7937032.1 hypothetical protein MJO28_015931 [Puccinia striiformis f. sp. tritici]KAI9630130.1 hypothetical protein KEM48_012159 [Puccinia striiformis f. sp. tritici PST-130]